MGEYDLKVRMFDIFDEAVISFSVAGLVEKKMTSSFLDSGADNHTASGKPYFFVRNFSIWWQIPQYSLMGMSEVFTSIPGK